MKKVYFLISLVLICIGSTDIVSRAHAQSTGTCQYFPFGDANCDQQVSLVDFELWRNAFFEEIEVIQGDFNKDNKASLVDLEILIRSLLDGLPELTATPGNSSSPNPSATPALSPTETTPSTSPSTSPQPSIGTTLTTSPATPTTPTTAPTAPPSNATYPAQVLNLTNWKVTVPIGTAERPTEIEQPQLATYKLEPWFVVNPQGGVRFRAPVNAPTTSGSNYPRSELREMKNNGQDRASWSSTDGQTHIMVLDQAITAVPQTKRHVVAGQIHDGGDDVIVIRLEYPKLFIDINGDDGPVLDANYTLGERFQVKFEVSNGQTRVYYKGAGDSALTLKHTLTQNYSGAYFKAGAYTQSNCSREAANACTSDNYGEVIVYDVQVSH